jgi:hypothetical protein
MFVSLNEIDVSVKRAMRGIGMSWGVAEEAGKAARFLCSRGAPGVDVLLPLLKAEDGLAAPNLAPLTAGGSWRPRGKFICPILAGAALTDDGAEIVRQRTMALKDVRAPLFVLPFLARLAREQRKNVRATWAGASVTCGTDGSVAVSGALTGVTPIGIEIMFGAGPSGDRPLSEKLEPVEVDDALWQELQAFAARTYVPASEQSRLKGAGAGLRDND